MRTSLLLSFLFGVACLVTEHAEASLRAIPLTSARRELQTLPYAFFVSEIRKANGDPWCMTAINGVNDGNFLGFDLCDFVFPRDDQLFQLDSDGKIRSKLSPSQCFAIQSDEPDDGHSRIFFESCDSQRTYNTFTHDRGDRDTLSLKTDSSYCIKQTGNGPDKTDSFRTFKCDTAGDDGIYFSYLEYQCSVNAFSGVDCCEDSDCSGNATTCQDYKCTTCDINDDGTGCCLDSDCPNGQKCEENACITKAPEIPGCSTDNIGTECCNNDDCPTAEYTCELDACVTAPFFLVSDYDPSKDWCVSANKGVGGWAEVGFEPCITSNTPAIQLWRHDTQGRIRSNSDLSRCMVTGPEGGTLSGFKMVMASCRLNEFQFGSETVDKIHLAQDERYCLTSYDENVDGRVSANICEDTGKFDFELDFV
jgi:hypothetical protein